MSKMNVNGGGCGCLLLVIVILLAALAMIKPPEKDHRTAFAQRTPILRALFGVQELVGGAKLKYHDFFFFSVMTVKLDKSGPEIPVSFGFFGKVYYGDDK